MPEPTTAVDPAAAGAESFRARVEALAAGQSAALVDRFEIGSTATPEAIRNATEKMRGQWSPAIARAKKNTGGDYTVENGEFIAGRDRASLIVAVVVTRVS